MLLSEPLGSVCSGARLDLECSNAVSDALIIDFRDRHRIGDRPRTRPQFCFTELQYSSDLLNGPRMFIPAARPQHYPHDRKHNRHLDQDADHGCQCGTRLKAKERDRGGDRQLEEVEAANSAVGQATLCGTPSTRLSA